MKIRKRYFKKDGTTQNFWPSFTDVMSTIALVLFFLMLLAYIQNILTGQKLAAYNVQISEAEKKLFLLQDEVDRTQAEVERGKLNLKLSEEEIEKQKKIIAASNQELGNLRTKLENIALLRVDILEKVKESIEREIGTTNYRGEPLVAIGDNANLIINESLVFDYNSYSIKEDGKKLLKQFALAFERILTDEGIRNNIDAINIEGHTDDTGASDYNMDLSAKRATSVLNFLMISNPALERQYGRYFSASGYSKFRPMVHGTSESVRRQNRRIEISIKIKDSNIQNIINDYLSETNNMFDSD